MDKLKVKRFHPNAKLPQKKPDDAGYDLFSLEHVTLAPFERKEIRTGVGVEIPIKNWYGQILDKSSVGALGCKVFAGVIDNSYRGEVVIIMQNFNVLQYLASFANIIISKVTGNNEPTFIQSQTFKPGQKVAQIVFLPHASWDVEHVNELSETERGEGKLGSTGQF